MQEVGESGRHVCLSHLDVHNCYVRTFSYDNMFVTCTVTVEMIPKKDIMFYVFRLLKYLKM